MSKPNILFLFADDMRYDTIAAIGNPQIITPNLDELVKNGTSFLNAHIPGATHAAVCMPSRAMLNTGRFLFSLEKHGSVIPKEHALMGETLKNSGYNTFGTGKWHNCPEAYARSFTDGAEIYFGGMYDHWKVPAYSFDPTGEYSNVINDVMNPMSENGITQRRCDHVTLGKHSTDLFREATCKWLEGYDSDKPFYAYVSYMAPHDPRSMPQKYMDMYNREDITVPENFMDEHPFEFGARNFRDEKLAPYPRDLEDTRRHIHEYYAIISHLDDSIGQIIESLKKNGQYENTIIIFAADNGLAVGQHGLMGKQNNYEHSIRVPLVMSGPDISKDETRDSYVYLTDIFPTLCDLVGIETPDTVEGISFKTVLTDNAIKTRDLLFAVFEDKIRTIKDYQYKIIEYKYENLRKTQLFDLMNDPLELNNLAHDEKMQPIVKRLRNEMKCYAKACGDTFSDEGKRFWTDYIRVSKTKYEYVSV